MIIRSMWPSDIPQLLEIHEKYYKDEFNFPEFYKHFLCSFSVIEDDKIIVSGGVKLIAESVLITNKDFPVQAREEALLEVLNASKFICSKYQYDELHAFVQDPKWEKILLLSKFRRTRGNSLVIGTENG